MTILVPYLRLKKVLLQLKEPQCQKVMLYRAGAKKTLGQMMIVLHFSVLR